MCKKAFDADGGCNVFVTGVFSSVVSAAADQCSPGLWINRLQSADDSLAGSIGGLSPDPCKHQEPAFAFDQGVKGNQAFPGDQVVGLPVTVTTAILHGRRS